MTITQEQIDLLNRWSGGINHKVQLGTLIANAESVVASEIALADGAVLIGNASGVAAAKTMSGDVTHTREGVATIANLAVSTGKLANLAVTTAKIALDAIDNTLIADNAVSIENIDAGAKPVKLLIAAGVFTTVGGDANEQIAGLTGVVGTDTAVVWVQKAGATPRTVDTITPGVGVVDLVLSGDPSNDHILGYFVFRAAT